MSPASVAWRRRSCVCTLLFSSRGWSCVSFRVRRGTDGRDGTIRAGERSRRWQRPGPGKWPAQGPDLIQLTGPPYSGPQWGSLTVVGEADLSCQSRREPGAAIWTHALADAQGPRAEFTDPVDSGHPCLVRRCVCRRPVRLRYKADRPQVRTDDSAVFRARGASCSRAFRMQRGQPYYSTYPFPGHGHAGLVGVGPVSMEDEGDASVLIHLGPGESTLLFAAGSDWPPTRSTSRTPPARGRSCTRTAGRPTRAAVPGRAPSTSTPS
jgi:hypothetical protein